MVTLKEFIEKSVPAWQAAKVYIQCYDNIDNPPEIDSDDSYLKEKISRMGLKETDIKFHILFDVSDDSRMRVGYNMIIFYLRSDKSILCAEFVNCTNSFLNITKLLGKVNGVEYKSRKSLTSSDEVFYF